MPDRYEDVYHEEEGHWETITVAGTRKVICGGTDHNEGDQYYDGPFGGPSPIFDNYLEWKAHQEAFLTEMRKTDPYYQCTGRHRPAQYIYICPNGHNCPAPNKQDTEMTCPTCGEVFEIGETHEEDVWVVDLDAYTEHILVEEGHWEYAQ